MTYSKRIRTLQLVKAHKGPRIYQTSFSLLGAEKTVGHCHKIQLSQKWLQFSPFINILYHGLLSNTDYIN